MRRTRATQRTSHVKLSALWEASCDWSKAIIYIHSLYNLYSWCCKSRWNYRELEINQNGWTVQPHYHATFVAPIQMTGMLRLTLYMERFLPKPQHLLKFIRGTCQRNSILLTVCLKVTHANKHSLFGYPTPLVLFDFGCLIFLNASSLYMRFKPPDHSRWTTWPFGWDAQSPPECRCLSDSDG